MGTHCEQTGTHTDMTEKITFPRLHWWVVNIWNNRILEHPQRNRFVCLGHPVRYKYFYGKWSSVPKYDTTVLTTNQKYPTRSRN